MKNQMNQKIYKNTQNNIFRATLSAIAFLAIGIFTTQVKAQTVLTTIEMGENGHELTTGRVTVFNAKTGRQIANGVTFADNHGETKFVFASPADESIVFVVLTDNGNIGFGKGSTGLFNYAYARQPIVTMPFVHADRNGDVQLNYTDQNGNPIKKAVVTTVEWSSLGNARRGKTDADGNYLFKDPKDLAGSDFLAVEWTGSGTNITLTAILTCDHTIPGGVDYDPTVE